MWPFVIGIRGSCAAAAISGRSKRARILAAKKKRKLKNKISFSRAGCYNLANVDKLNDC